MARLPQSLGVEAPRAERPSQETVRPTDFGLGDAARAMSGWAAESARTAELQRQQRTQAAEKLAATVLTDDQAKFEGGFAETAQRWDPSQSGFAAAQLAAFDENFQGQRERADLDEPTRLAIGRQLDNYRADVGRRAIDVESRKRGAIVAAQERAKEETLVGQSMVGFNSEFGSKYQERVDSFDGSGGDFATGTLADFDAAAEAVLANADDRVKPALQSALASRRVAIHAQAMEVEDKAHDAFITSAATQTASALVNGVRSNPVLFDSIGDDIERAAAGLPAGLRAAFVLQQRGQAATARIEGLIDKGDEAQARAELADGRYDRLLEPGAKDRLMRGVEAGAAGRAQQLLEASQYGADVDPGAILDAAQTSGREDLKAQADYYAMTGAATPAALARLSGGGGRAGFLDAVNFVIDDLEGGDVLIVNDNGRGGSRFGINQTANPDLNVATLTRPQAVARYKQRYWDAVGASRLPPGMDVAAFDAAVLFGPDDAKRWLGQSGGDVGRFLALEQAEMRRLAKADPGKYGDDLKGWLNRVEKVRRNAADRQAFASVQEGLSSDPIKFAMGGTNRAPLAAVPGLPEAAGGPEWQAALRQRLAIGQMMTKTYRAPLRMLTAGEAAFFKDQIERDPMAGVRLAGEALAAVGPQAARSLMAEAGQQGDATVQLHLADLTAAGLGGFAERAAKGLALKEAGAKMEPRDASEIEAELQRRAGLFANQPELRQIARQTAEAAMLADGQGGKAREPWAYVNSALGAVSRGGKTFGGVTRLNGADTIIPSWLAADHADEAVEVMAQSWAATGKGPVYRDGSAIPADRLERMRFQLMPSGRYRVLDGQGAAMMAKGGKPFEFDWDSIQLGLRNRLGPQAVFAAQP